MLAESLLFYLFSSLLILSGVCVISARNAVHSVLFLILAFFNAAGLFLLLNAELLAMALVIVYVGAVAVLFLFVVMMLDINFRDLRTGVSRYLPIGGLIGLLLAGELAIVGFFWKSSPTVTGAGAPYSPVKTETLTNAHALGNVLYTDYFLMFQLAGMILLVAMIGAIVLTLRKREGTLRQDPRKQMQRTPADTLVMNKVTPGKGVKL